MRQLASPVRACKITGTDDHSPQNTLANCTCTVQRLSRRRSWCPQTFWRHLRQTPILWPPSATHRPSCCSTDRLPENLSRCWTLMAALLLTRDSSARCWSIANWSGLVQLPELPTTSLASTKSRSAPSSWLDLGSVSTVWLSAAAWAVFAYSTNWWVVRASLRSPTCSPHRERLLRSQKRDANSPRRTLSNSRLPSRESPTTPSWDHSVRTDCSMEFPPSLRRESGTCIKGPARLQNMGVQPFEEAELALGNWCSLKFYYWSWDLNNPSFELRSSKHLAVFLNWLNIFFFLLSPLSLLVRCLNEDAETSGRLSASTLTARKLHNLLFCDWSLVK